MGKRKTPEGVVNIKITLKGIAYLLAVENGLCPKVEYGYDTTNFSKFWDKFEVELKERLSYEYFKKQEGIYRKMGKLKDGKELRDYIKAHSEDIERYDIKIPFLCKYPHLPLIVSLVALVLSVVLLFL